MEEQKRKELRDMQSMNLERHKGARHGVQEARYSMYLVKNQQVKNVKQLLIDERRRFQEEKYVQDMELNDKKNEILTQRNTAKAAVDMFRYGRYREVQDEARFKAFQER
jgi:hypothetical protein